MSSSTPLPPCRICAGQLAFRWRKPVLQGQFSADYAECRDCQALQVPNPHWLDLAYANEGTAEALLLDPGRLRRNLSAFLYLGALRQAEVIPGKRTMDFGGGSGLLTQLLLDDDWDAWQSDTHIAQPDFAAHRFVAGEDTSQGDRFDMISLLEVLEHLTEPMHYLSQLKGRLQPNGVLIVSTEIYHPSLHGPDWNYLAPEGGQHVTFWSMQALDRLRAHLGFSSLGCFPGDTGFMLVFSHLPDQELQARLLQAWQVLQRPEHAATLLARIDLRHDGIVRGGIGLLHSPVAPAIQQAEQERPMPKRRTIRSLLSRLLQRTRPWIRGKTGSGT